jgi:hypothetical protein
MPVRASIAAWARDPAMSWRASRLSNPIEALIASMIASGPAANPPAPHRVGPGREIARLTGEADWNGPAARAVLEGLLADT